LRSLVEALQEEISDRFVRAGMTYLHVGFSLLGTPGKWQVALGNLTVAVELLVKGFLASRSLLLVYKDLSLKDKVLLICPDSFDAGFNWRPLDANLRWNQYKTFGFDESISNLFALAPDLEQALKPHMAKLSQDRNHSVHSVLPSVQEYEATRAAYVAARLARELATRSIEHTKLLPSEDRFLKDFDERRVAKVRTAVNAAMEKARTLGTDISEGPEESPDWDSWFTPCPICGNSADLCGTTDIEGETDEDGDTNMWLVFKAHGFYCKACGLTLDDLEELRLAKISVKYDRDEDVGAYIKDNIEDFEGGAS
jgi:hypothetical protein